MGAFLYKTLLAIGVIVIGLSAFAVAIMPFMAIPGNPPTNWAGKLQTNTIITMIFCAPVWACFCLMAYAKGWYLGEGPLRFLWIPLTFVPILIIAATFKIVEWFG